MAVTSVTSSRVSAGVHSGTVAQAGAVWARGRRVPHQPSLFPFPSPNRAASSSPRRRAAAMPSAASHLLPLRHLCLIELAVTSASTCVARSSPHRRQTPSTNTMGAEPPPPIDCSTKYQ
ncbi:hypothetical protein BDA96_03G121000 [Sorghum bicolor]|uniref:Uncharacterized protein n=1 Tax=Sorghum bicolor TaxID=4558 RepID=A0A921RCG3_SORBI|nr:hypothetical protein BDA96_03G121000 [Sorghum bicolor]